ncbi:ATP-binding protein [Microbacterium sp. NPDC003461]
MLLDLPAAQASDELRIGQWRLARIEVVNWGTFDGAHRIEVSRKGHLITGASGSGKSSLLDAIAAVLTPEKWLRFNAAAQDASSRGNDRGLVSYVRGAWSKEADEHEDRAVASYLRSRATWSGVLLHYENLRDAPVTLVRLFHLPGTSTSRADLKDALVMLRTEISLTDLAGFVAKGIEARRLKAAFPEGLVSTSSHGGFYARVRRVFGIGGDNALHLLHKTQSAKNLGDLDHLFRTFMLDRPETFDQARNATEQFRELNTAHEHVVELRRQVEHLDHLAEVVADYDRAAREVGEAQRLLAAQEVFQDRFHLQISEGDRADQIVTLARETEARDRARAAQREAEDALQAARLREANLGGADAALLRSRIEDARRWADRIRKNVENFAAELSGAGIESVPGSAADFAELQESAREALGQRREGGDDHAAYARHAAAKREMTRIDEELTALKNRRSNIEPRLLGVRERLCAELGVSEKALPFGGELIDVLPEYAEWTGALERVLRPIASALLVRDVDLPRVRRYIDGWHLGTRLVIEAVPAEAEAPRPAAAPQSLLYRIRVTDGPFASWLQRRLSDAYDISCVDSPDDLDAVERGVTIAGQVKLAARRYEKNDRHEIGDRRHWILGSDNQAKIDHLLERRREMEREEGLALAVLEERRAAAEADAARRGVLRRLLTQDWSEFDVAAAHAALEAREGELTLLTERSRELEEASREVASAEALKKERDDEAETASRAAAIAENALQQTDELIERLTDRLAGRTLDDTDATDLEARYRAVQRRIDGTNIAQVGAAVVKHLHAVVDESARSRSRAEAEFVRLAAEFRTRWEAAAADLAPHIDDRGGFLALREAIRSRGLPDHEENFRRLLREKSRDLIGHLLKEIRDAPKEIEERIDPVNASLGRSLFDVDRFLRIRVKVKRPPEAIEFIGQLKSIVDGSFDQDDARAEERFTVLKSVMDRLESADNGDRIDALWRQRCLDTREHVTFQAQEVDRAGRVLNVHDSSAGLSGGQRQKLVIFCLAAALRYQLTDDDQDVPTYGTIVLDEAFDKADSQYTRMAMDVFREFGFHMILATPQKLLQTIERYIGAVTSVSNPTRRQSLLANVPFEEAATGVIGGAD